ncbi:hypothetical protein IJI69_04370 [Candidatus Saccharibacteria bacterium]|nr:hypothetical protein [Candidatus Saccharibacteria bacterium]
MSKKNKVIISAIAIAFAGISFIPTQTVKALSADLTKIGAQHFNSCYSRLPSSAKLSDVADYINYNRGGFSVGEGTVPLPNTVMEGSIDASPTITCQEFFFGGSNGWAALIDTTNYNSANDQDAQIDNTKAFLEKLGYEPVITKVKEEGFATVTIVYNSGSNRGENENGRGDVVSNTLNVQVFNEDGKNYITSVFTTGSAADSSGVSIEVVGDEIRFVRDSSSVLNTIVVTDDMTYEELVNAINQSIDDLPDDIQLFYTQNNSNISFSEKDMPISNDTVFQRKSMTTAMNNLLGIKSDYGLSESEIYNIYAGTNGYLSNGKYVEMTCGLTSDPPGGEWMNVRIKRNGATDNTCYVRERQKTLYNGAAMSAGSTGYIFNQTNLTLVDIVARVNAINPDNVEDAQDVDPNGGNGGMYQTTDTDAEAEDINCWTSAGGLGWWTCEIIKFARNTVVAIYDSIVSNFLEFRAEFLDINGKGASVYAAWQIFQSFANIVFVIVLLVVIFSQLTGIGIDNLGIKRVLPKLIVAAVLINLSYIICMLLVDISNIVGVGTNSLFSSITSSVGGGGGVTGTKVAATIMETAVAGTVGGLAAGTVGIWGGVVVLPLLLGLLTALIGILFFFILLGARQAAIIMLIVVSPVAFACYMLPNTKTIFDKWLKIFEAMLILFPICGVIMGGSSFASMILMQVDTGFLGSLIAMLVGVVPFFFIPGLLRGAFTAMGNLGARITGFGQNMGRRLSGAIGNSDAAKDFNTRMRTGIDREGNLNALGRYRQDSAFTNWAARSRIPGVHRLGTMAQESNRRANARAQAARIKYLDERNREDRLNAPGYFQQYQRSQEMAFEKEQLNTAMDNVNDQTDKGENQGKLFAQYDAAVDAGDIFTARAIAEIAGRRKDTANAFIQKFKEDSESGKYRGHEEVMAKVAKQISTGENSKNYRASNAMGFEYASQIVQGNKNARTASGGIMDYGSWKSNTENVKSAMEHHVTNGRELYGQSNASLRELAALAGTDDNKQYLADLARRGEFEGLNSGGEYDQTKEKSFKAIKDLAAPKANSSDARPGETFDVGNNAPTRGNMTDGDLQRLKEFYQRKVDSGTATPEDRETINRIDREMNIRKNGPNDEQGTPV